MQLTIRLTLTRNTEMPLTWDYTDAKQARFFATLAGTRGYHVKWTELYQ